MITALLATLALALATSPVPFNQPPSEVVARIAANCMARERPVVEISPNMVKCELPMTYEQKGHVLFTRFYQRNFSRDVHHYVSFVVVPHGEGSLVQHRQWHEATINGSVRSLDIADRRAITSIESTLDGLSTLMDRRTASPQ